MNGADRALDDENFRAGFLGDRAESRGPLRYCRDDGGHASRANLLDPPSDQILFDRLLVNRLKQFGHGARRSFDYFLQLRTRILITRLDALEIEYSQPP